MVVDVGEEGIASGVAELSSALQSIGVPEQVLTEPHLLQEADASRLL